VQATLHPLTGRFPGNLGPDVVVDLRTGSLQAAIDTVTDTNGDGYIIIGAVAQDGGAPGGSSQQRIEVSRAYNKPFALIGCGVLLVDPLPCDGRAAVQIHASAGSPEFPVGSGVTLYIQEIAVVNSESSEGWFVEGNGRFLEAITVRLSEAGLIMVGNNNTIRNSVANNNTTFGFSIQGNGNTLFRVRARNNAVGDGIKVLGSSNSINRSTAESNGAIQGAGINVSGPGNEVKNSKSFANKGHGILVGGGTAASPNLVRKNVAGEPGRGNLGNGILLNGTGAGAAGPIDILGNVTQSNALIGLGVSGSGHRLKDNVSGGSGAANFICQYAVASGNFNATGNKVGTTTIAGAGGSPFPNGCF
jgi:hypothetical protein